MRKWRKRGRTTGKGLSVTDRADPRAFSLRPAPLGDPRGLGFGSGSPAVISAQTGDKQGPETRLGRFFVADAKKTDLRCLLGWGEPRPQKGLPRRFFCTGAEKSA